jgi:hypothetical protein
MILNGLLKWFHMREIVIYYIYVIKKQVKECAISCTSEK